MINKECDSIANTETKRVENKERLNEDFEQEVIAFLNYKEGGTIYVGIKKNGQVVGLRDVDLTQLQIKDRIKNNIKPQKTEDEITKIPLIIYEKDINEKIIVRYKFFMINDINVQTLIKGDLIRLGGTGRMFLCSNEQGNFIFKPSEERVEQQRIDSKAYIQEVAYEIQKIIDPTTAIPCKVATIDGMFGTVQEFIEVDKRGTNTFRENIISGEELHITWLEDILREYIVDYLICNYDTHERNFIVDLEGRVRGIDKEQGCRFIGENNSNSPLFITNYNAKYGETGSIYTLIFERMRKGKIPKESLNIMTKYVQRINAIPNEEYIKIFQKYIDSLDGDKSKIIEALIARKERIESLVTELNNHLNGQPPKFTIDDYQIIQGVLNNDIDLVSVLRNYIPDLDSIL